MTKIILDTDIGTDVDDALCLGLALAVPAVELIGITTVSGDTDCRARIARKLARLADQPQIPVFAGAQDPVDDQKRFFWHGQEGDGILDESDDDPLPEESAGEALVRLIEANPEAQVVAVGPMTNIARLIREAPETAAKISRLTIMGGHLKEIRFGEKSFPFGIDYNICSDPAAATIVLEADIPTRLVTADVTLQTWLTPADRDRLAEGAGPARAAILRALDRWTPIQRSLFEGFVGDLSGNAAFLHDPLALACALDESHCTFEELGVRTGWDGDVFRTYPDPQGRRMRCATAIDGKKFAASFVEALRVL
jgi:purine nucleosidase